MYFLFLNGLGLTGESDSEMDFEEDSKDLLELKEEPMEGLGIESLLEDSANGQDVANSKLSDAAALAESFQPKGNTLESTQVYKIFSTTLRFFVCFNFLGF